MAKSLTIYTCAKCDAQFPKWSGRCMECGAWGTLKEGVQAPAAPQKKGITASAVPAKVASIADLSGHAVLRVSATGFPSQPLFPQGIPLGGLILVTGDPGTGKSTLCLQVAMGVDPKEKILYFSAEESAAQIKERIERVGSLSNNFFLAESTSLEEIIATIEQQKARIVFIDSLQTIMSSAIESDAGSINQIRAITAQLMQYAKQHNIALFLIGHVTKDGSLAGPKSLEHLVDVVCFIESDKSSKYRLVRIYKNRFGASGAVSVMHMTEGGLKEVKDAATIFIQHYEPKVGSSITIAEVDDQLFFIEVQALVTKTNFGYAKRTASGFSRSRLELLLAILKKHLHIDCDAYDVFVNIAGGFHVHEPAMDLAVAASILSSYKDATIPAHSVVFGELGLSGETRIVKNTSERLHTALKHGFTEVFLPELKAKVDSKIHLHQMRTIQEMVKSLGW